MSSSYEATRRGSSRSPHADLASCKQAVRASIKRLSHSELENFLGALHISSINLTECIVEEGCRLTHSPVNLPGLHYVLAGHGTMTFEDGNSLELAPHKMVIHPTDQNIWIDVPRRESFIDRAEVEIFHDKIDGIIADPQCSKAGPGQPALIFIYGYFRVQHGRAIDLFAQLTAPIVEAFDLNEGIDKVLKAALAELIRQDLGMEIMTSALMKQFFVHLFRRALTSNPAWLDNIGILGDAQIFRAFAAMVARPGANHSIHALAQSVGLSRSVFMARFSKLFGQSPMGVLQGLRMRQAATLLATGTYQIDRVAQLVGYASRSSFCRAFCKSYGHHPSAHVK